MLPFIRIPFMKNLFSYIICLLIITSCKKDNGPIFYGYHFFPVNEGHYVIYDVVDIFHDVALLPAHDTSYYQIKERIGETEMDGEGENYQKLYRYYRLNDTSAWSLQDVWTIKRTAQTAETLEENKRRISMAFSISYDRFWNYNTLNEDAALTARYENIYEPLSLGANSFDSTVRVEIENTISFIEYRRQYTIYASEIGKIYSVKKDLEILNSDTTDIKKGTEVYYTAVSFGVE